MADAYTNILRKTDPFVLDATVESLETISLSSNNYNSPLPLRATPASGTTDEDRPFLQTPFNKVDNESNKYRSPWKAAASNSPSSGDTDVLELEQAANEVWDAYRQLYYGHDAIGSVFVRRKGSDAKTGAAKKGGALEALFGIQKKCFGGNGTNEIARWDSVHTVTIEVPSFEDGTCEYKIKSAVWCRYQPENVGDVPNAESPKKVAKKAPPPPKKKNTISSPKLDIARLEVFDRAANHWDSKGNRSNKAAEPVEVKKSGTPLPPVPAVVNSSALYTKDTAKVCKLQLTKRQKQAKGIPVASHIQNIGSLLEKIEADVRSKLERVDSPKCVEVLQGMYRPSLSPGLKLPNSSSDGSTSMISKLGGHATGMGVGKGLIGEIALKAKSKGLGNESGSDSTTKNKAMENILANEKKKLKDLDENKSSSSSSSNPKAPSTWNQAGLKKSKVSPNNNSKSSGNNSSNNKPAAADAETFEKPKLRKTSLAGPLKKKVPEGSSGGAGFLRRPKLRKAASVRLREASAPPPTPEFMNFRSKLKSTAAK